MTDRRTTHDYQSTMQRAAQAFLERHEAQHLTDSDRLFENCVHHLTVALEVPAVMAQRLVHNAWSLQRVERGRQHLGVDWATGADSTVVYLIDTHTKRRYPISSRLLPQHLLDRRPVAHKPSL